MSKRIPKKIVAVIFGGRSGEHEVSLVSARAILNNLNRRRFRPFHVAIMKDGSWIFGKDAKDYLNGKEKKFPKNNIEISRGRLGGRKVDVVFPIIHGTYGEDGRLQGLLDMIDLPYVGCGVMSSAVCMDKDVTKRLLREAGIPVADGISVRDREWISYPAKIRGMVAREAGYPCFVKPARLGSSIGITKVKEPKRLGYALNLAFRYDCKALIERAVPEARELECAIIGNDPYTVAGPGEVHPAGEFYDFDDKYIEGASRSDALAKLPHNTAKAIIKATKDASRALGIKGMARVDFLMPKKTSKWILNEVNTLPGFTPISMYPKLWLVYGFSFKKLITELLLLAMKSHENESMKSQSFSSGSEWYH